MYTVTRTAARAFGDGGGGSGHQPSRERQALSRTSWADRCNSMYHKKPAGKSKTLGGRNRVTDNIALCTQGNTGQWRTKTENVSEFLLFELKYLVQ